MNQFVTDVAQYCLYLYKQYSDATKDNPLLGAIVISFSGAIFTWLIYNSKAFFSYIFGLFTIRFSLYSDNDHSNMVNFRLTQAWLLPRIITRLSKNFSVTTVVKDFWTDDGNNDKFETGRKIVIGAGTHWFFYRGRLFKLQKRIENSGGSNTVKEFLDMSTIGLDHSIILKMFKDIYPEIKKESMTDVFQAIGNKDGTTWKLKQSPARKLDSVVIPVKAKDKIISHINTFTQDREWFLNAGIAHKLSILLYGPPGTGKTSIIRALADHYKKSLYIINLDLMANGALLELFSQVKPGSIVCIEDLHTCKVLSKTKSKESSETDIVLNLGTVLNVINGVIPLDNVIIISTTNDYDDLDDAFKRKGRIDCEVEINEIGFTEVQTYVRDRTGFTLDEERFKNIKIRGSSLENIVVYNKTDRDELINKLLEHT